jgi:hypothetical protein
MLMFSNVNKIHTIKFDENETLPRDEHCLLW